MGCKHTWNDAVVECYKRDVANADPVTTLCAHSVFPNSWNEMRVGHSPRSFSERTIVEQFFHIADCAGARREKLFYSGKFDNVDVPQKHMERLDVLRSSLDKFSSSGVTLEESLKAQCARLELSVHTACVFNERFMNKNVKMRRDNTNDLENEMKKSLMFFEQWREHSLSLKTSVNDKEWEKRFISQQTYNNLRLQIAGFFLCSRCVFEFDLEQNIKFTPFLHSNTSSLESHFSKTRAKGADTPQKHMAGVANTDDCACKGTVDDEEDQIVSNGFDATTCSSKETRKNVFEAWIADLTTHETTRETCVVNLNAHDACHQEQTGRRRITEAKMKDAFESLPFFRELKGIKMTKHCACCPRKNSTLEEIAIAHAGSGLRTEEWFKKLLTPSDEQDLLQFDDVCQTLVGKVLYFIQQTCVVGNRSRHSNFWYQICCHTDKENVFKHDGPFSELPAGLDNNQTGMCILLEMIVQLIERWATNLGRKCDEMNLVHNGELSKEGKNCQMNGHVGFALSSTIKRHDGEHHKSILEDVKEESQCDRQKYFEEVDVFLKNMQMSHADALRNKEHLLLCHANSHEMMNHGVLALIAPKCFKFASLLMSLCHEEMQENQMCKRAGASFTAAKKVLLENEQLRETFEAAHCDQSFTTFNEKRN